MGPVTELNRVKCEIQLNSIKCARVDTVKSTDSQVGYRMPKDCRFSFPVIIYEFVESIFRRFPIDSNFLRKFPNVYGEFSENLIENYCKFHQKCMKNELLRLKCIPKILLIKSKIWPKITCI